MIISIQGAYPNTHGWLPKEQKRKEVEIVFCNDENESSIVGERLIIIIIIIINYYVHVYMVVSPGPNTLKYCIFPFDRLRNMDHVKYTDQRC